ncbi:MAG: NAD(P)-dependent oxidoreductase [Saprospiraceae bacterium]
MKIGIIREGKVPPDARVPFSPQQCAYIMQHFPVEMVVQPSEVRCYKDEEYQAAGITLVNDVSDCDILMGIKEVPVNQLIPNKTYCFFSHTIKAQPHNRHLLQAIINKKVKLIDYEVLTNERGQRLIAFGKFAGMVGAHNAIWTYGRRTGAFSLQRMKDFFDYAEAQQAYKQLQLPPLKIVVTGSGRVGMGAAEVLLDMGIQPVSPEEFLLHDYHKPVFTHLSSRDYMKRKDGGPFIADDFYSHPEKYCSNFESFTKVCNIFINGIYWNPKAPSFFTKEDMCKPDFNIKVIADVTCDLAPESSVPSTLKASTIADPVFGYDPLSESEAAPFQEHVIDMMTIDNLPSEMPRDASAYFGEQFIQHILPELLHAEQSDIIKRATVTSNGHLTPLFQYLHHYVEEKL